MFEAQKRSYRQALRLSMITAEEYEKAIAELEAQEKAMHPIPVDKAVASMADLARKRSGSAMGEEEAGDGNSD